MAPFERDDILKRHYDRLNKKIKQLKDADKDSQLSTLINVLTMEFLGG